MAVSEQDILYLSAQLESRLGDIQRENAMLIDKLSDYKSAQRDALRINRQLYRRLMQYSPHAGVDLHRNGGAIDKPHGASARRPGGVRGRRGGPANSPRRPRGGGNPPRRAPPMPMDEDDDVDDLCESPNTLAARRRMLVEQRPNVREQQKNQTQPQQQIIVMQQKQTGSMRQVAPVRVCHSVEPQMRAVPVVSLPKVEAASVQQPNVTSRPKVEPKVEEESLDEHGSPPDIPAQQNKREQPEQQCAPQHDVKTVVRAVAPQSRPATVSTQSTTQVVVQVAQASSQPQTSQSQTAKQRLEAAFKAFAKQTGPAIQQEFLALGNATLNQRTLALELVSRWGKLADEERKSYFAST